MQFMGPIVGTPESHLAQLAGWQLVHRLGVRCRGDGLVSSSKTYDAHAGYEGASALVASLAGRAELILHAAGWLEFGRTVCLEKMRSDNQILEAALSVNSGFNVKNGIQEKLELGKRNPEVSGISALG
jgi:trimethylamine--corrinoid protein Co-methyltransferase